VRKSSAQRGGGGPTTGGRPTAVGGAVRRTASTPLPYVFRFVGAALAAALLAPAANAQKLAGEVDAKGLAAAIAKEQGRVVVVNFWATWCVPCREEYPDLTRLEKAYRDKGVSVLGVSIDSAKDLPKVDQFLARMKPDFPNYRKASGGDDQDFIESVDKDWGGELPFTVVYARDGRKTKVLSGKQSYGDFEAAVKALLR
jgi:thiol-disulfide isomerase/thioredoxin